MKKEKTYYFVQLYNTNDKKIRVEFLEIFEKLQWSYTDLLRCKNDIKIESKNILDLDLKTDEQNFQNTDFCEIDEKLCQLFKTNFELAKQLVLTKKEKIKFKTMINLIKKRNGI